MLSVSRFVSTSFTQLVHSTFRIFNNFVSATLTALLLTSEELKHNATALPNSEFIANFDQALAQGVLL